MAMALPWYQALRIGRYQGPGRRSRVASGAVVVRGRYIHRDVPDSVSVALSHD